MLRSRSTTSGPVTVSGDQTITGDLSVGDDIAVTDDLTVNDDLTVLGDAAVTGTITSGVASGSNALTMATGARVKLGGGASDYIASDGTNLETPVNINASAFSASVNGQGYAISGTWDVVQDSGAPLMRSYKADGATSKAFTFNSNSTYSTAGAKLVSIQNGASEKAYFDKDGALTAPTLNYSASLLPVTDENLDLGSSSKRIAYGYILGLKDQNNTVRFLHGPGNPNFYRGGNANSGTNAAHRFGHMSGMDGTTRIAEFYSDAFSTLKSYISVDGDYYNSALAGTAGSGTGITVNATSQAARSFIHKITVTEAALTDADTEQDIVLWTVPAKTKIQRVIIDVTTPFTGGGTGSATISVGPAGAETAYVSAGNAFAGAAVYGDADGELGASLAGGIGHIPSWSSTTAIEARFTADTTVAAYTAGSATFYIEGLIYP